MSDEIPLHVQEDIMKRLPVKSLVQFRCVSKAWKSLIDSSEFVHAHTLYHRHRHTRQQHLLLSYGHQAFAEDQVLFYRSYIDDETFPKQRSVPTLPQSVKQLIFPKVVGSSQGLLCLLGSHPRFPTPTAVVWNPSVRKCISVIVPGELPVDLDECHLSGYPVSQSLGFGVCPVTNDPKIVAITRSYGNMVYTLSSGEWRTLSSNLPLKQTKGVIYTVATDRFLYWKVLAEDDLNMILSFDLTSEAFDVIDLPDSLARDKCWVVHISKLRESLVLLHRDDDNYLSTVWMMEQDDGAPISFTKLYAITTPHNRMVGFRKNGIPIMQYDDHNDDKRAKLVVYEPNSEEHNNVLEILNYPYVFYVDSYMETLLLLGRSDYSSY